MMDFEKQFPGLDDISTKYEKQCRVYIKEDIINYCLDKKLVKKVIKELSIEGSNTGQGINEYELKKRLGLLDTLFEMEIKTNKTLKGNKFKVEYGNSNDDFNDTSVGYVELETEVSIDDNINIGSTVFFKKNKKPNMTNWNNPQVPNDIMLKDLEKTGDE